jgi:DNA-binding IclR family transcriptional regulator
MSDSWTFLTNHARVLLCIARDPDTRMADIAAQAGIRERSVQQIVADLERGGYLTRHKEGRRNTYTVHRDVPFRHF